MGVRCCCGRQWDGLLLGGRGWGERAPNAKQRVDGGSSSSSISIVHWLSREWVRERRAGPPTRWLRSRCSGWRQLRCHCHCHCYCCCCCCCCCRNSFHFISLQLDFFLIALVFLAFSQPFLLQLAMCAHRHARAWVCVCLSVFVCVCGAEQARSFLLICAHASQTLIDNRWMNGRSRSPLGRVRFASARVELSRVWAKPSRAELSRAALGCSGPELALRCSRTNVATGKCERSDAAAASKRQTKQTSVCYNGSEITQEPTTLNEFESFLTRARSSLSCSCNRAQGSAKCSKWILIRTRHNWVRISRGICWQRIESHVFRNRKICSYCFEYFNRYFGYYSILL